MKYAPMYLGIIGAAASVPMCLGYVSHAQAQVSEGRQTPFLYSNLAATTTVTLKSGQGTLHSISVNTEGASSDVLTVYDNTATGTTTIATIDTTKNVGTLLFDVGFNVGLTVLLSTGTAANVTISYK